MRNEHRPWEPKIPMPKKITQVEIILNVEEIEDLVKCLYYVEDSVDLKTWNEKEDDAYECWIWNLRSRLAELLYEIEKYNKNSGYKDDWRIVS